MIADEAHSSQSGNAANQLKLTLTAEEQAALPAIVRRINVSGAFAVRDVEMFPKPKADPFALWVGGHNMETVERAARYGTGWLPGWRPWPELAEWIKLLKDRGVPLDDMDTSYFLSRDIVMPALGKGMSICREKLFANIVAEELDHSLATHALVDPDFDSVRGSTDFKHLVAPERDGNHSEAGPVAPAR